jgi:hypothetical protein
MYDYTSYNRSQWNRNKKLKEKPGSIPVQIKQIRIKAHKSNNTKKQSTNNTQHSKNKYPYYRITHTLQKTTHTHTHTLQKNNHSTRYTINKIVTIQSSTLRINSP